jgi:hypothetical protein
VHKTGLSSTGSHYLARTAEPYRVLDRPNSIQVGYFHHQRMDLEFLVVPNRLSESIGFHPSPRSLASIPIVNANPSVVVLRGRYRVNIQPENPSVHTSRRPSCPFHKDSPRRRQVHQCPSVNPNLISDTAGHQGRRAGRRAYLSRFLLTAQGESVESVAVEESGSSMVVRTTMVENPMNIELGTVDFLHGWYIRCCKLSVQSNLSCLRISLRDEVSKLSEDSSQQPL